MSRPRVSMPKRNELPVTSRMIWATRSTSWLSMSTSGRMRLEAANRAPCFAWSTMLMTRSPASCASCVARMAVVDEPGTEGSCQHSQKEENIQLTTPDGDPITRFGPFVFIDTLATFRSNVKWEDMLI